MKWYEAIWNCMEITWIYMKWHEVIKISMILSPTFFFDWMQSGSIFFWFFPKQDSVFRKRPRANSADGCGIFWRRRKFELVASEAKTTKTMLDHASCRPIICWSQAIMTSQEIIWDHEISYAWINGGRKMCCEGFMWCLSWPFVI